MDPGKRCVSAYDINSRSALGDFTSIHPIGHQSPGSRGSLSHMHECKNAVWTREIGCLCGSFAESWDGPTCSALNCGMRKTCGLSTERNTGTRWRYKWQTCIYGLPITSAQLHAMCRPRLGLCYCWEQWTSSPLRASSTWCFSSKMLADMHKNVPCTTVFAKWACAFMHQIHTSTLYCKQLSTMYSYIMSLTQFCQLY